MLLLLLLLRMPLLVRIKIGIISALIGVLMPHIHWRGHGISVTLSLILMHESGIATRAWSPLHVHTWPTMVLLAGITTIGVRATHLGVLLLLGIIAKAT